MRQLLCATGNNHKFDIGRRACAKFGIELVQTILEIDEIQGESPEPIIRDKAQKAFAALGKPVVVSDDSWSIAGLRGFPGAYMKSINHWFSSKDFIRLTKDLTDRHIVLQQWLAYQDEYETVVFEHDIPGTLLPEARGSEGPAIMKIVTLNSDNGLSIAEVYDRGMHNTDGHLTGNNDAWHQLAKWYAGKVQIS